MTSDVAGAFVAAVDGRLALHRQLPAPLRASAKPLLLPAVRCGTILLELHTVEEHNRPVPRGGWYLGPPVPFWWWDLAKGCFLGFRLVVGAASGARCTRDETCSRQKEKSSLNQPHIILGMPYTGQQTDGLISESAKISISPRSR